MNKKNYTDQETAIMARKPTLVFIFITLLIDITGLGLIIPVLPQLIMELTGESAGEASRR